MFLGLMKGNDEEPGFFARIKSKKLERARAMDEVAALLKRKGISVSGQQVDNKWKSLLARYRAVEDHNGQTGNNVMANAPFHEEIAEIMGERASTRPVCCAGTGVPVVPSKSETSMIDSSTSGASTPSSRASSSTSAGESSNFSNSEVDSPWPPKTGATSVFGSRRRGRPPAMEASDDENDDDFGLLPGEKEWEEKQLVPEMPDACRTAGQRKKRKSTSRSSEVIAWATKYQQQQEIAERDRLKMAQEHHEQKLDLLSRLVNAVEKR